MDDLKIIWQKLDDLKGEVGDMIEMDKVESVFDNLKKVEDRQKKWMPWMIPYIILVTAGLYWFYGWISQFSFNRDLTNLQIIGILFIPIGGFLMLYLIQLNKIPLDLYEHDKSAVSFLKIVKEKLAKKRKYTLIANFSYLAFLITGMHLLAIGWWEGGFLEHWKPIVFFYGTILMMIGIATYFSMKKFDERYKDIMEKTDRFLAEE